MKCPICPGVELKIAERQGVEIDYCPECRGVWLDRGELDKIIDRSFAPATTSAPVEQQNYQAPSHRQHHREDHHDGHGYQQSGYHKRKSWLSELFD
ncbi:TFIIB-type zinc ribbon-containing protein [Geomonas azotofigens]|uniref:TFIIB-type zinc ribbon-containing protein n=1 Tax=Geomonas azotofigens TaxID=2843196 RepID=UPI001C127676|nr:zf-TFIIB domain-containing protein [Geomonas azotofigens]MBU5613004.1 zf-TFIIB domain-containing protein [Geomonas azotofigens]